jgi:hypothetical protein
LNHAIGDLEAEWVQVSVFESVVPALNEAMALALSAFTAAPAYSSIAGLCGAALSKRAR